MHGYRCKSCRFTTTAVFPGNLRCLLGTLFAGDFGHGPGVWGVTPKRLDDHGGCNHCCMRMGRESPCLCWNWWWYWLPHCGSARDALGSDLSDHACAQADSAIAGTAQTCDDDGNLCAHVTVVLFAVLRGDDSMGYANG